MSADLLLAAVAVASAVAGYATHRWWGVSKKQGWSMVAITWALLLITKVVMELRTYGGVTP